MSLIVGTRVAYSRNFLRSTFQFTGRVPHLRGEIITLNDPDTQWCIAKIRWDDGTTGSVNVKNLVREDRLHLEAV